MASKKMVGFYRPHRREATWYTGELTNHQTGEVYTPPSMTKQSFVEECDINNILREYSQTGLVRHMSERQEMYVDLPDPVDFQEAMDIVISSQHAFDSLPSSVRSRFGNDPVAFLDFMGDPANQDEIIRMGLAKDLRPPAPAPAPAPAKPPSEGGGGEGVKTPS